MEVKVQTFAPFDEAPLTSVMLLNDQPYLRPVFHVYYDPLPRLWGEEDIPLDVLLADSSLSDLCTMAW